MRSAKISSLLHRASMVIYLAALAGPGFYYAETRATAYSFALFMFGWLGPVYNHYSWFANPAFFVGYFGHKNRKSSLIASIASLLFAISFAFYATVVVNEAGTSEVIVGYGWGYYFWILSITCLVTSGLLAPEPDTPSTNAENT